MLQDGKDIALISDAGTPLISDPGYKLIKKLSENDLPYTAVPGPSSVINSIVLSGIEPYPFTFLGFIPSKGKLRDDFFDNLRYIEETTVFFDSPHRIKDSLKILKTLFLEKKIAILREQTKIYEEVVVQELKELDVSSVVTKGEFTIVLEGISEFSAEIGNIEEEIKKMRKVISDDKELISYFKWKSGLPKRKIYEIVKKTKKNRKM